MSLSLIFRLQAAFAGMWALQLVFIPEMVFTQYNWTPSFELVALAQACGTAMAGLAIINYGLPKWTNADQLKTAAKSAALIAGLSGFCCCPLVAKNAFRSGESRLWERRNLRGKVRWSQ